MQEINNESKYKTFPYIALFKKFIIRETFQSGKKNCTYSLERRLLRFVLYSFTLIYYYIFSVHIWQKESIYVYKRQEFLKLLLPDNFSIVI